MMQNDTPYNSFLYKTFDVMTRVMQSRRTLSLAVILTTILGFATYFILTRQASDIDKIYWVLNINVVILLVVATIIARHIVRLWQRRKSGVAGSRLHIRLASVFGVLAAVPAVLTAVFAAVFFFFGVQSWFNVRVSTAVNESLAVAKAYLNEHQLVMRADALAMANDINRQVNLLKDDQTAFDAVMRTQSYLRNLPEAIVFTSNGRVVASSGLSFALASDKLPLDKLEEAKKGDLVLMTTDGLDRIRALVRLDNFLDGYLYVGRLVDANVLKHISSAEMAVREYTALDSKKVHLQLAMTAIFLAVAFLLMLGAVWFGLVFSERLAIPLGGLISAAERVRAGNLTTRVEVTSAGFSGGDDEMSLLGRAFNRMTTQLEGQQKELMSANRLLDERRRFSEAVLSGASSGVVSLQRNGVVMLANARAEEILLGNKSDRTLLAQNLALFIPEIEAWLNKSNEAGETQEPLQVDYLSGGLRRTLLLRLTMEQGGSGASVLTIDDISALVSAQRSAAWSDVARRIAHEIKNPLTPIQLSAERLRRKYLPQINDDPETFAKCVDTIIRQVADIGRLVSEFSSYARMPVPVKKTEDMAEIVKEALELQRQAFADISFTFHTPDLVKMHCDRGQMTQVVTNLLQNSIESIQERLQHNPLPEARIAVVINATDDRVMLTVEDNGLGLPEETGSHQLFEPYVTTKKRGSGLGLAIVRKIIEDHNGSVSIENIMQNNLKSGAKAVIVFATNEAI